MTLIPLLSASPQIQVHAFAAFTAIALGAFQLALPKGTLRHRFLGYAWATIMTIIAFSSLFIHTIRLWGPFSPIHLLSVYVLIGMPYYAWQAYNRQMTGHGKVMKITYALALIITGVFTFLPGRIMHEVLFGS